MPETPVLSGRFDKLTAQIASCMTSDRHHLRRQANEIKQALKQHKPVDMPLECFASKVAQSLARRQQRLQRMPAPMFADDLPINQRREEIAGLIAAHQVLILCGETGSGKTTQIPKICLELKRGAAGMIGCTQPRRIAARSVAARIASELGSELGQAAGYKIRFSDKVSSDSYIKVMTDGILLAETQGDRFLQSYDTIIIDEAHERSLNIDFLLGYLKRLLPKRPDLKLIITSATIDVGRFSEHFDNAPVMEVSGRTYPVEVHYRPINVEGEDEDERDRQQALLDAVDEVFGLASGGDILIFLSGEREIREAAESLRKHHPPHTEILPLFARLSAAEQNRVFHPGHARRIILATNVAETSLTVPGIRYVIDPGFARINRYSYRRKVELLQIEKISRASAAQRAGRCGRVISGICVRLYDEEDYLARPEFTDPEIRRSNLAGVILRMQDLELGDVEQFPFIDPPDTRMISDGFRLLTELGAADEQRRLTPLGKQIARLPIDPRIARMVLAGVSENCLSEILVIASALSIQDPRMRPMDAQQAADEKHRRFTDERSDFLSFLKLWGFFDEAIKHKKSNKKLLRECQDNFLSYLRLREWRDLHQQLRALVTEMNLRPNQVPASYDEIHRALLAGLLSNIGFKDEDQSYLGARGVKFGLFPGSALFKRGSRWVMAAELTETTRLYARCVAKIEPEWVEKVAGSLCNRVHYDPHWEKKAAYVMAFERVSLFGLVINPKRKVNYAPINPREAREIFIRGALVKREYETRAAFFQHNLDLLKEVEALEHKSRRRDVLVDEECIFAFYDILIPPGIHNGAAFEQWRNEVERQNPSVLFMKHADLMRHDAEGITEHQFPEIIHLNGTAFKLSYYFDPGHLRDGVTITVPLSLLNQINPTRLDWLAPGLLREKISALIKSLPQSLRRHFVPVPETVRACIEALHPCDAPLADTLAKFLQKAKGIAIPASAWGVDKLPDHLRMNYKIIDEDGKYLAMGRNLDVLKGELGENAEESFNQLLIEGLEREGVKNWDFGDLLEKVEINRNGHSLHGYPALVDNETSVALKVFDSPEKADEYMAAGLRRLFLLALPQQVAYLRKSLPVSQAMCLQYTGIGSCEELKQSFFTAVANRVFFAERTIVRSAQAFDKRVAEAKTQLLPIANEMAKLIAGILSEYHEVRNRLASAGSPTWQHAIADIREQLDCLVYTGFILHTSYDQLRHYPRYLKAIRVRLEKLKNSLAKDIQNTQEINQWWQIYLMHRRQMPARHTQRTALEEYRWMLEELRVSLFAQELKTAFPISVKRLQKQLESIQAK